jgi:hypothetical protein
MDDAIIAAALERGVTQADVVRECLEYGLVERFGIKRRSPRS